MQGDGWKMGDRDLVRDPEALGRRDVDARGEGCLLAQVDDHRLEATGEELASLQLACGGAMGVGAMGVGAMGVGAMGFVTQLVRP